MDSDSEVDNTSSLIPSTSTSHLLPQDDSDNELDALFSTLQPSLSRAKNLSEGVALINSSKSLKQTRGITGGGSFQALGLPPSLLKALLQRGFTNPTPIQRLALPSILGSLAEGHSTSAGAGGGKGKKLVIARDHLCMARTGSGKTLCYLLPLLAQLLKHETSFGSRALVLVPTRELALQVLKVGKDLARGIKGEGEGLRWAMIVGGEGMEEQFALLAGNPDVIIATPGRLLHLLVEMSFSLSSISYCVFDEADRLFELGFAEQLHEILHRLPPTRQTLLFSATLPSSLVGFAKAGLQNPKLIRLDADTKISKELQMSYLSVKEGEKEAALLGLLREVIKVPLMTEEQKKEQRKKELEEKEEVEASERARAKGKSRKRKREDTSTLESTVDPSAHQTLIFVSTKHHVEYLSSLLLSLGYSVSPIYGSMDQVARSLHLSAFRANRTSILVVTDLAARGIDIPGVENVVNYDFPNGPRAFVHRVGRTARAGRKGWAYTLVTMKELPHLLDLELFLGRPVRTCPLTSSSSTSTTIDENIQIDVDYSQSLILGTVPRPLLDTELETHLTLLSLNPHLQPLQLVASRGQKMYEKGLQHASPASYRRAKLLEKKGEGLASSAGEGRGVNTIFSDWVKEKGGEMEEEERRAELMKFVNGFTPGETVFEVGSKGRGNSEGARLMKERRKAMKKSHEARALVEEEEDVGKEESEEEVEEVKRVVIEEDEADREEVEAVFGAPRKRAKPNGPGASYKDPQFYLNYEQEGADTERGYALTAGDSFVAQASQAQYDVSGRGDTEGTSADALLQRASTLRWDRRTKKFVKGDGLGADNKKLIKSESGQKLPASFKSGVFDEWKKKNRIRVPKVGEGELKDVKIPGSSSGGRGEGKKYRHKAGVPKISEGGKKEGRTVGKPGRLGAVGGGLKSADEVRKARVEKAKRVKRSTQPGKKGGGSQKSGGGGGGGGKKGRR